TPVASVAAAVERALDEDKLVIVCAKSFSEPLTLSDSRGARIYGGFDCDDAWQPVDEPSVFAPKAGPALRLESVEGSLFFSGFEFRAADATEPGESSIAAIVNDVEDVTFDSTVFVAGDGRDGADGQPIPGYDEAALPGNDASGAVGGSSRDACTCSETAGGRGGGAASLADPNDPTAGLPDYGGGQPGNSASECGSGGSGLNGKGGSNGSSGSGANSHGTLDSENALRLPASGQPGGPGTVGQGGGGGKGGETGGGGGGACGGCGGKGGEPGQGGGASIGILVLRSTVTLRDAVVHLGDAGDGGDGAPGQEGQDGGLRGDSTLDGCDGGNGGDGGAGGHGGGGAGGIVVAV